MKRLLDFFSRKGRCRPLAPADGRIAARYRSFQCLLSHNRSALERIAQLERLYHGGKPFSLAAVRLEYVALLEAVYGIVHALEAMAGTELPALIDTLKSIDDELEQHFNPMQCPLSTKRLILPFSDILPEMKDVVGSKAANLAVIGNSLGLPVPEGFAVTAYGCERFLEENGLTGIIAEALSHAVPGASQENEEISRSLQNLIREAEMPPELGKEMLDAFVRIEEHEGGELRVAMRSSAVGEDTEPTFAGQYETVLNVGREGLFAAYKQVLASKYASQAISYRMQYGLDDRDTPMCVAAVAMVDALASGVVYSRDPAQAAAPLIKVNSLWGLGEQLVDGSASPDVFLVDRGTRDIRDRTITRKMWRLNSLREGGIALSETPEGEQETASLGDEAVKTLAGHCLALEEFFGGPQDVEWASSRSGELFLLQSRPLYLPDVPDEEKARREFPGHPVILAQGVMASPGVAAGRAFVARGEDDLLSVPKDAILVVKTASPKCATVAGSIKGLIADVGSATSHMASVAREFGLPAIVDAREATALLHSGDEVTLAASSVTVYRGRVEGLLNGVKPARRLILDSPVHRRTRSILDLITPLNLVDPQSPSFSPEGCRSLHDIIRFAHEQAVRTMFAIGEGTGEEGSAVRLTSRLPIQLYLVDLGGGLRRGITTCDEVSEDMIESRPLAALWRGFTHPGVNWEGTMNAAGGGLAAKLAVTATADLGEQPGGDSYAVVSADYLNFSAKFAYHFATVDALCGENSSQNYISLQFSGGAGAYYGRSLRVQLMADILDHLGFQVDTKGDLLEATFARHDGTDTGERLDQLGRLLASSKLLDMTLSSQEDIALARAAFLKGDYDLLARDGDDQLRSLYAQGGRWLRMVEDGRAYCVQDGSPFGRRIGARVTGALARVMGMSYYEFLDNIEANYHFPLAIVREGRLSRGTASVRLKLVAGKLDQAGGIAFAVRNRDNYLVLRVNALENNIILFEFRNGRRHERVRVERNIESGVWHHLQVALDGGRVEGGCDGEPVISFDAGKDLDGYVGLWTKADSTTWFDELIIDDGGGARAVAF